MKLHEAVRLAKHAAQHVNADNARRFTHHVVPEVTRPARIVWNQAIGFLFFVLAVPAAVKGVQFYRENRGVGYLAISVIFVVVMLSFGISSFLKARRIASRVNRY